MSGAASSIATRAPRRRSCRSPQARAQEIQDRLGAPMRRPAPTFLGVRAFDDYPLEELRAVHRLDAVFQRVGVRRQVSGHPAAIRWWARRRAACMRTPRACSSTLIEREMAARRARWSDSSRPTASATTTSTVYTDESRRQRVAAAPASFAPAEIQAAGPGAALPGGFHRARVRAAAPTTSARSP